MLRIRLVLILSFYTLAAAAWGWSFSGHPSPGIAEYGMQGCLAAVLILVGVGIVKKRKGILLAATVGLFLVMSFFIGLSFFDVHPFGVNPYNEPRYAAFQLLTSIGITLGLYRRIFGARWLAMAMGGAGTLSAGMNLVPWIKLESAFGWMLAVYVCGAALVVTALASPELRDDFAEGSSEVWVSKRPLLRVIRWTIVANIVAVPLLLVYGWTQPIVPQTAQFAPALAALLMLALYLVSKERAIGAILMALGGSALLAMAAVTTLKAQSMGARAAEISYYYLVFWGPAGLLALVCGAMMARPLVRMLRS